ncbi:MAG: hypothetical protein ACI4OI_07760, partial [Gemmiger sp.]
LLLGNVLQIGTYAAPMLAAFLLIPVQEEYGARYSLLLYLMVSILSVLLVPDKELALFYALVIGYYPVLKRVLDRLRPAPLRWAAKLAVFNAATAVLYGLLFLLIGPELARELLRDGPAMAAALLTMGNLSFVLCDLALENLTRLYCRWLRRKLKKLF